MLLAEFCVLCVCVCVLIHWSDSLAVHVPCNSFLSHMDTGLLLRCLDCMVVQTGVPGLLAEWSWNLANAELPKP